MGTKMALKENKLLTSISVWILCCYLSACGTDTSTFSVPPDSDTFFQNANSTFSLKSVDMLWVIDNSGSMDSSQQNLRSNFNSFISQFVTLNLDFKIAVTTTDAFLAAPAMESIFNYYRNTGVYGTLFESKPAIEKARFRDGYGANRSGVFNILPSTPNLVSVFSINALQGVSGFGDERSLQSMRVALESNFNQGFYRNNSHLAVIILTDEDDFSNDSANHLDSQYNNPNLHAPQLYVDFLKSFTNSTDVKKNFSAHSISIQDQNCLNSLNTSFTGRKIATRVSQFVDLAGGSTEESKGIKASLCGDFATELQRISRRIISLSQQFSLSRIPIPESIRVRVNGVSLPTPTAWVYLEDSNSVSFKEGFIPGQGAAISVTFDPKFLDK